MASRESRCDFDFVTNVPDELFCVVCHLVLNEPVQLVKCGHRFCKVCFNQIKTYADDSNITLVCPLDREETDDTQFLRFMVISHSTNQQVFPDTAVTRTILNLIVYCSFKVQGCLWSGELRNLKEHEEICPNNASTVSAINTRRLLDKIGNLEELLKKKDQEVEKLTNKVVKLEAMVNKLESSLKQLPNSISIFHEVFQLKVNVLCSQAMMHEWIISFDALELGEVLSDYFYPASLPSMCFQLSANILDDSLKVWIRRYRAEGDNKCGKLLSCVDSDMNFEVCLAGADKQIHQRSIFICKDDGNFTIGDGFDRSRGIGWEKFLKSVSNIKEKWIVDNKLHLYSTLYFQ